MNRDHVQKIAGYTLVEILATTCIVAVLLALGFPQLQSVMSKSTQVGCANNLRQLHQAINSYAADNDGKYPWVTNEREEKQTWSGYLRAGGYIPDIRLSTKASANITFCPGSSVRDTNGAMYDYIANYGMNRAMGTLQMKGEVETLYPRMSLQSIKQPSKKILLMDAGTFLIYPNVLANPSAAGNSYIPGMPNNKNVSWTERFSKDALNGRHFGHINVLLADGHVESWTSTDFTTDAWNPVSE